ncbi:MFS transporter [Agrobacterium tumefaciens]|nr:MFS transporter [Agrobacterium tumefaciens]
MSELTEGSKERKKLSATTLSNLAVGIWLALIFAPLVTVALSEDTIKTQGWRIPVVAFIGAGVGGVLYYLADRELAESDDSEER